MTFKEANKISIKGYLIKLQIFPTKEMGYYGMYRCPFRDDNDPSMKVDYAKNLWFDHGTGMGGTLIDLVMKIEQCSEYDAIITLEKEQYSFDFFSFQGNTLATSTEVSIKKIQPLQNKALLDYVCIERKISVEIAKRYLQEIYYSVKDKSYFSIAFKNNGGGYELRNAYFKNCVAPKEITTIRNSDETNVVCLVFEGFMDFLSYQTLKKQIEPIDGDVIILNSTSLLNHVIEMLPAYNHLSCFLDNDNAGCQALGILQKKYGHLILDQSIHYREYNDLNDFLCGKKMKQKEDPVFYKKSTSME